MLKLTNFTFYDNSCSMYKINKPLINELTTKAYNSERKRFMHNFHTESNDPVQRMINSIEPFSYVRPHRHCNPDKREVFLIITGKLLIAEFDNDGKITESIVLDHTEGNFGAEVSAGTWHTIISLEKGTSAYELKDGPYFPLTDKDFAPWAPKEGDSSTVDYIKNILQELGIKNCEKNK